jgi:hypothetical protein
MTLILSRANWLRGEKLVEDRWAGGMLSERRQTIAIAIHDSSGRADIQLKRQDRIEENVVHGSIKLSGDRRPTTSKVIADMHEASARRNVCCGSVGGRYEGNSPIGMAGEISEVIVSPVAGEDVFD